MGVDICEFSGKLYLITVDYFSNFIEVDLLTNTSAKQVMHCLKRNIARYGIPRCLHSENAQQFLCTAFTEFMQSWCIIHSSSSPGHQSANGKAEAAVKSVKNMLKCTSHENSDQYLALLEMRNTPNQDVNRSPAQLVFGRFTRSVLPVFLKPCTALDVRKRLTRRRQTKQCYNRYARPHSTLHANLPVYFQHPPRKGWTRGTIVRRIGQRLYIVKSIDGSTYKCNRVRICPFISCDPSHSET